MAASAEERIRRVALTPHPNPARNVIGISRGDANPGRTVSQVDPRPYLEGESAPDTGTWKFDRVVNGRQAAHEFTQNGKSVDTDTDLYNIAVKTNNPFKKIAGAVGHGIEVFQNSGAAVTDPYAVYKILTDRGVKVNYTLK